MSEAGIEQAAEEARKKLHEDAEEASDLVLRTAKEQRLRNWMGAALLILTCVLAVLSIINTFVQADNNRETDEDIRLTQYTACVQNANELREDVREEFIDLKESILIPVHSQVRDTIPPNEESYKILDKSVTRMQNRADTIVKRIPDVDCLAQYPPLDNQTYPQPGDIPENAGAAG